MNVHIVLVVDHYNEAIKKCKVVTKLSKARHIERELRQEHGANVHMVIDVELDEEIEDPTELAPDDIELLAKYAAEGLNNIVRGLRACVECAKKAEQ